MFFYFARHISLINKELNTICDSDIKTAEDILRLTKMDYEIAKVIDAHSKTLNQNNLALEYIFEMNTKNKKEKSIFEPPHGEA